MAMDDRLGGINMHNSSPNITEVIQVGKEATTMMMNIGWIPGCKAETEFRDPASPLGKEEKILGGHELLVATYTNCTFLARSVKPVN